MSIVFTSRAQDALILLTGAAVTVGVALEVVARFKPLVPLIDLSLSGALFNGSPSSGTLVGARPGSTFSLGGTPPAGLSIPSTGGRYNWTGAGSGSGVFTISETNPNGSGSPHVTTIHWSITAQSSPDTTPDQFTFTDVSNAALSTVETSNTITVSGLGTGVSVSAAITGDSSSQMQLNGGSWVSGPLSVQNGDQLKVRNTSSSSNSTAVNTTLTIGGVSDTFTSTTLAAVNANALHPGFNLFPPSWDQNMFTNKFNNTGMKANLTAGGETNIPAGNMDRDRNPTSLPAGCNAINKTISKPLTANGHVVITWTGNAGTVTARNGSSIVSGPTLIAGQTNQYTMTLSSPTYAGDTGIPPSIGYQIPDTANYPRNFFASFEGADTTQLLDATALANFQQVLTAGTFLRFMDCTGVNYAGGPISGGDSTPWLGGSQSAPVYALDLTNYNRTTSADWVYNNDHNGTPPSDGVPFEVLVAMCNQLNCNLWYNINWNAAPALIRYYADYARDNLNPSLKVRWEVSNEVWNFGFYSRSQATKEAGYDPRSGNVVTSYTALRTSGTALTALPFSNGDTAARYAEKIIEVSQYISTEFAAARTGGGAKPASEMVCAWQQGAADAVAALLDYQPAGSPGPLKNYIHVYSTAPYSGPQEVDASLGTTYDSSRGYAPLIRGLMLDSETRWKLAAEARAAAEARGLVYHSYEMGPAVQIAPQFDDVTNHAFALAFDNSPEMGTVVSYIFQSAEQFNPGINANYYSYNGGQSAWSGCWNITTNVHGDQANSHKFQAMKAFQAGTRILFDLDATLVATAGASVGTVVGIARRRYPGSTVSINSPFSIVDTTAADLQIAIADATQFTTEGAIAWTITETGGNPSTTHTTSGTCQVTRACSWAISNPNYDVTGTYGQTINRIGYDAAYECVFGTVGRTSGYIEFDFNCGANSHFGLAPLGSLNLGSDAHSLKVDTGGGLYGGGSKIANWPSISPTDHCALLLTPSKHLFFFKNNTAYGADGAGTVTPASDVGGVDVSGVLSGLVGGLYPAMLSQGNLTKTTIRTTDAQYLSTRPANSTEWAATIISGAPTLSSPAAAAATSTSESLSVSTNQASGTMYWIVSTSSTPPSVAQIKAGHSSTGSAATASGNAPVTATGIQTFNAGGLVNGTTYYAYFMQENTLPLDSTVAATSSFTTSTAATLTSTNGASKFAGITLSSGNLEMVPDGSDSSLWQLVRTTREASASVTQLEVTLKQTSRWQLTIENGLMDFSTAAVWSNMPGNHDANGVTFQFGLIDSTHLWIFANNNGSNTVALASAPAINDVLTVQLDKTAGTVKLLQNGTLITTVSGVSLSHWYASVGGTFNAWTDLLCNFAGPFAYGSNPAY